MTNQPIVIALTLGFLAFTLSVLPVTMAQAECFWIKEPECPPGMDLKQKKVPELRALDALEKYLCCTLEAPTSTAPVDPEGKHARAVAETECKRKSGTYNPQTGHCDLPIKPIGKGSAALRTACKNQGWRYDEQTGKCTKPSEAKAACESKGPNYRYDLDTGGCVKAIGKSQGEQASDEDDGYKQKKKNKKRHDDDDYD